MPLCVPRLVEGILHVSEFTDRADAPDVAANKPRRKQLQVTHSHRASPLLLPPSHLRTFTMLCCRSRMYLPQLRELHAVLAGLLLAVDYDSGQAVLESCEYHAYERLFQTVRDLLL